MIRVVARCYRCGGTSCCCGIGGFPITRSDYAWRSAGGTTGSRPVLFIPCCIGCHIFSFRESYYGFIIAHIFNVAKYNYCPTSHIVDWATFPGNYTTIEADTKQTWVDGQKIYKRTVVFNQLGNVGAVRQSVPGVGKVVDFEATMVRGSDSWKIPYKYIDIISFEQGELKINSVIDLSQFSAVVTIYYVKTA